MSVKRYEIELQGGVGSNEWEEKIVPAGEAAGLVDLVHDIVNKTVNLNGGEIATCNDNKKVLKDIRKDREKESKFAREADSFTKRTRRDVEKALIKISFKY